MLYLAPAFFWITNVQWWLFLIAIIYHGAFIGIFALATHALLNKKLHPLRFALAVAALWTIMEWARSLGFVAVPVGFIGYQLADLLALVQISQYTGIYGVSFLAALINTAFYLSLKNPRPAGKIITGGLAIAALALWWGSGAIELSENKAATGVARVAVIQGNIKNAVIFETDEITRQLDIYEKLSQANVASAPDLIVWPETAVPCFLFHPQRQDILDKVETVVRRLGVPVLTGTQYFFVESSQKIAQNAAALFKSDGTAAGIYAKMKLVPFMEHAPAPGLIPLIRKLGFPCIYIPGQNHTVFQLRQLRFSSVICFETLFPNLVRQFPRKGAAFLINITNDSQALGSMPFYYRKNLDIVRVRAIENRRSFVRVANNGVSAAIDPYGRLTQEAPIGQQTAFTSLVPLNKEATVYTRFGDWIIALSVVISLANFWSLPKPGRRNKIA